LDATLLGRLHGAPSSPTSHTAVLIVLHRHDTNSQLLKGKRTAEDPQHVEEQEQQAEEESGCRRLERLRGQLLLVFGPMHARHAAIFYTQQYSRTARRLLHQSLDHKGYGRNGSILPQPHRSPNVPIYLAIAKSAARSTPRTGRAVNTTAPPTMRPTLQYLIYFDVIKLSRHPIRWITSRFGHTGSQGE